MRVVLSNILVKEIKEDIKSSGGIILGNGSDVKFRRGIIEAVGENIDKVKVGDTIHFDRHRIYPINYEGQEYLVMNYENIVIVEN
jgi:co-chaperonin GroES (HSP10)